MLNLKFLNKKETRQILNKIKDRFGTTFSEDYIFLKNSQDKIFIISRDFAKLDTEHIRLNNIGLYVARIERAGIRLTIEGSQLIKPTKNTLKITKQQQSQWLNGQELDIDKNLEGYLIVKSGKDFIGTGKAREGKLLNFIPKRRRIISEVKIFKN